MIDRAEPGAEVQRAGPFFLHLDRQVLSSRHPRVFRKRLDFFEVTKVIEAFLRRLNPDAVENVAGGNQDFTADDLVLGARVADDIDPLDEGRASFLDVVVHVDPAFTRRNAGRRDLQVHIAAATVRVRDFFRVLTNLFRRINAALFHFQEGTDFCFGRRLRAGDANLADVINRPFLDHNHDRHLAFRAFAPDFLHLRVDVAVVLVIFFHRVHVLLELGLVEPAGFIDEGIEGLALRLHLLAQNLVRKFRVAFETNPADRALGSLRDRVNDA